MKQSIDVRIEWDDDKRIMSEWDVHRAFDAYYPTAYGKIDVTELPDVKDKVDVVEMLKYIQEDDIINFGSGAYFLNPKWSEVVAEKIQPIIDTLQRRAEEAEKQASKLTWDEAMDILIYHIKNDFMTTEEAKEGTSQILKALGFKKP